MKHFYMYDCVHWPEKEKGKCPWQVDKEYCDGCQDYMPTSKKIDYNSLPMELFEKISQYDLGGMVLNDCAYLSHKSMLEAVEVWWNLNGNFIMNLVLSKFQGSSESKESRGS